MDIQSQAQIVNYANIDMSRSLIGYVLLIVAQMLTIGSCILQLVILSTTEAELIASHYLFNKPTEMPAYERAEASYAVVMLNAALSVATGVLLPAMITHKVYYLRTFNVGCC